jgi:hypothetical protein
METKKWWDRQRGETSKARRILGKTGIAISKIANRILKYLNFVC